MSVWRAQTSRGNTWCGHIECGYIGDPEAAERLPYSLLCGNARSGRRANMQMSFYGGACTD